MKLKTKISHKHKKIKVISVDGVKFDNSGYSYISVLEHIYRLYAGSDITEYTITLS